MQPKFTAIGLITRTLPFLWTRVGAYLLFGLVMAIYLGIAFGISSLFFAIHLGIVGFIFFLVALGAILPIYRLAESYFFYLLKAAHVAVMTELLIRGQVPTGNGQIAWGKQAVQSRFRDTNIMFVLHQLVSGVVRTFTSSVSNTLNLLPIDGMDTITSFMSLVVRYSTTYVDAAVLSRAYMTNEPNMWATAAEGTVLYAQCWKPILKNAVKLAVLSFFLFLIAMVVLGIPALLLALILPKILVLVIVVMLAVMLKLGVGDTYALASTLIIYHRETANMVASPEWTAKLESVSDKFKQLQLNAATFVPGVPAAMVAASAQPVG